MAVPPRLTISETGSPLPTDPHAGSLVAGEVALGAVFVLGVDALSILAGFGLFYALLAAGEGWVGLAVGGILAVLLDVALAPLGAALGAHLASAKRGDNGLGGALGGAYLMQIPVTLLAVGGLVAEQLVRQLTFLTPLLQLLFLVGHYLGLPIGASLGIHSGSAVKVQPEAPPRRISMVQFPTRPHELYAAATPSLASPLVTWAF
jgi:hypothetical protein